VCTGKARIETLSKIYPQIADSDFKWLWREVGQTAWIFEIMMGFPDKYLSKRSKDLP
jgi:hypothetical protein